MSYATQYQNDEYEGKGTPRFGITDEVLGPNKGLPIPTGYHLENIQKGVLGTPSKITEEYLEFMDAVKQNNPLMQLIELSDMLGAIDAFAKQYNMSVQSLLVMTEATKRAFESGARK